LEENFKFGGGATATQIHPAVLVAMLVAILLLWLLPRRYVVIPFLMIAFLAPFGQEVNVAGMHFYVLRIVILGGLVRLLAAKLQSKERLFQGTARSIDKLFCLWALVRATAFVLLYREGSAVANQVAFLLDSLGGYFLLRYMIQDEEDIARVAKVLGVIVAVLGVCMLTERVRGINVFGFFGTVSLIPTIRDGQIRAQGPFGHPILAGTFGATLVPLFFWLWTSGKARAAAVTGFLGSTAMVLASVASTSAMAYAAGISALGLWPLRRHMRMVRWGIVLTLLGMALVMKAPVWFVIAHIDLTGASSGWHRATLIDLFIRNFGDWWLIGTDNFHKWGYDMWDTSQQFVAEGENGGLVTLVCFIAIISTCFSRLGKARKLVEGGDRKQEWFFWSLGAVLFAHVVAFFGISYWDQTRMWWFAFLAMVSAATASVGATPAKIEVVTKDYLPNSVKLEPSRLGSGTLRGGRSGGSGSEATPSY